MHKLRDHTKRGYTGVDVFRFLFACIIPLLHIKATSPIILIIQRYISRLGVPFFFAVSGVFLSESINKYGEGTALKKYMHRIGRMLLFWLVVYSPLLLKRHSITLQNVLFKTPAYLWYLSALLFAAIPFCLIKRKYLYPMAIALYIFGTLFSETYKWAVGDFVLYTRLFITTRNGLFFALPLMCIGESSWTKKPRIVLMLFSLALLACEISFSLVKTAPNDDRSMYFFLPVTIYYFIPLVKAWNPKIDSSFIRTLSSAIYVMQYGIINVAEMVLLSFHVAHNRIAFFQWFLLILIPTVVIYTFRGNKYLPMIF